MAALPFAFGVFMVSLVAAPIYLTVLPGIQADMRGVHAALIVSMIAASFVAQVAIIVTVERRFRRARRTGFTLCTRCAYARDGADAARCPECGHAETVAEARRRWRRAWAVHGLQEVGTGWRFGWLQIAARGGRE
jgi:uncharacterized paraquat-inducible protein A